MNPDLPTNPDVVIVGAGAAGIGSGVALTRLGIPFVILEAKRRVGGRAYSDTTSIGQLWDQGCHWFHAAENNPLRQLADRLRHDRVETDEGWVREVFRDGKRLTPPEQAKNAACIDAALTAIGQSETSPRDVSTAEAARLGGPDAAYARFVIEVIGGGLAEDMSALDQARYDSGDSDLAVTGGYGALIERLAAGLPIRLGCQITALSSRPNEVDVQTDQGTVRARAVILTVSTNVLRSGRILLEPVLPADVVTALGDVPLGSCEKIAAELVGQPSAWPSETKILALHGGEVFSIHVRQYGRPVITANLAGAGALRIGRASDAEGGALLCDVLAGIYGSDVWRCLGRTKVTRWSLDPHVLGAYSYCKVGRADARRQLMDADLGPLLLAGEAYSQTWFSTAHGAYLSGIEAAHKAAGRLGRKPRNMAPLWLPVDGPSGDGPSVG